MGPQSPSASRGEGSMETKECSFLVLGGGITGLSFAEALSSDDYLVCEALPDVGGYCQTIRRAGFIWDYSGHFFHFRHPDIEERLVSRIGRDRVRTVQRLSKVHFAPPAGTPPATDATPGDCLIDFPFQRNIHQLPHEHFLDCLVDLVEATESTGGPAPENFQAMLQSKFGKSISDLFLEPYNEKLYATDLARLDADAMGRFFPHADLLSIVRGFRGKNDATYNSTFTYPEGGAIEYVRAVQQGVSSDKVLLSEPVVEIDVRKRQATTTRRRIRYEHLVSCAPLPRLLKLARVAHREEDFTYNKVLVFNLGFDRKGLSGVHWIYFPDRSLCFYRVGFYDNIWNTDRMSLYVEIGYPKDHPLEESEIERVRARVLEDLTRVNIVQGQQLVASHHVVLDPAYVHITQASLQATAEAKSLLQTQGIYSIGRYGSWTYCSIEDNMVEARALAGRFNAFA